jgi:hypothetical protein
MITRGQCVGLSFLFGGGGQTCFNSNRQVERTQRFLAQLEILYSDIALLDANLQIFPFQTLYPGTQIAGEYPRSQPLQHPSLVAFANLDLSFDLLLPFSFIFSLFFEAHTKKNSAQ